MSVPSPNRSLRALAAGVSRASAPSFGSPRALVLPALVVGACALLVAAFVRAAGFVFEPAVEALSSVAGLAPWILAALVVRSLLAQVREDEGRRASRSESLACRLADVAAGLLVAALCLRLLEWGTVLLPALGGPLLDRQLSAADRALCLGLEPAVVLQQLVAGVPLADAALDWLALQGRAVVGLTVAWLVTRADPAARHRAVRGLVLVVLGALALRWLLPALGPVFLFPELSADVATRFPGSFARQSLLLVNHGNVQASLGGADIPIVLHRGLASMPALAVALPAYAYALGRHARHPLAPFWLATALLGSAASIATGGHFAVDVVVAITLGVACALVVAGPRPAPAAGAAAGRREPRALSSRPVLPALLAGHGRRVAAALSVLVVFVHVRMLAEIPTVARVLAQTRPAALGPIRPNSWNQSALPLVEHVVTRPTPDPVVVRIDDVDARAHSAAYYAYPRLLVLEPTERVWALRQHMLTQGGADPAFHVDPRPPVEVSRAFARARGHDLVRANPDSLVVEPPEGRP